MKRKAGADITGYLVPCLPPPAEKSLFRKVINLTHAWAPHKVDEAPPVVSWRITDSLRRRQKRLDLPAGHERNESNWKKFATAADKGQEILLAPAKADGVIVLPDVSGTNLKKLKESYGLRPFGEVEIAEDRYDLFFRLCAPDEIAGWTTPDCSAEVVCQHASMILSGLAGIDPNQAHWGRGGHAPGFSANPFRGDPPARLVSVVRIRCITKGGGHLLDQAAELFNKRLDAAWAAARAGIETEFDIQAMLSTRQTVYQSAQTYLRRKTYEERLCPWRPPAASPTSLEATNDRAKQRSHPSAAAGAVLHSQGSHPSQGTHARAIEEIDYSIAFAALSRGASVDRVQQLLDAGIRADRSARGIGLSDEQRKAYIAAIIGEALASPELTRILTSRIKRANGTIDLIARDKCSAAVSSLLEQLAGEEAPGSTAGEQDPDA